MLSGFMYSAPQKSIHENEAELNALSCEEMERVHKDVYGFGTYDIIENDDFICNRLIEFEHEIFKLSTTTKQAEWYLRGLQINPTYVNSNDLRLRFLRREFFNAKKAAIRYTNYWKDKVFVWGEDKAFRKLKISDFDDNDQSVLKQGPQQILKERDFFGRVIFIIDKSRADSRITHRISTHYLTTSRIEKYVLPFILFMLGSELRYRFKIHMDRKKIFTELEKFGINRSTLPKDIGGTSIYSHEDWLKERWSQDI